MDKITLPVKPRVAIFVESHEGYGHFNIISQLTHQLKDNGAEVMVLSSTLNYAGAVQTFNFHDSRIIHLPLVDYRVLENGKWEYVTPDGVAYDESDDYLVRRQKIIKDSLSDFQPHVIVSEIFPFIQPFRKHDMDVVNDLCAHAEQAPITICLSRDIIHSSKPNETIRSLNVYFDRMLVRGDEKFSKLEHSQPDWKKIQLPIEYVGNFITFMPKKDIDITDSDRHVVIFGGGGYLEQDLNFYRAIIKVRPLSQYSDRIWDIYLSENAEKHVAGETGENVSVYLERLANEESFGRIRIFQPIESKKFRKELANAALVVTRGPYNTSFELLSAQQPHLIFPRNDTEQIQRANTLYQHKAAGIFPDYPVTHQKLEQCLENIDLDELAELINAVPSNFEQAPIFNNHGAETFSLRLVGMVNARYLPSRLNFLVVYQNQDFKAKDSFVLADLLERHGHCAATIDIEKTEIKHNDRGVFLHGDGVSVPLSMFDGVVLRSPIEVPQTQNFSHVFDEIGLPVYQNYHHLLVGGNKIKSQKQFELYAVPTPLTYGTAYDEIIDFESLDRFLGITGSPFVIKSARGHSGAQVEVIQNRDMAINAYKKYHQQAHEAGIGGALAQQFISSHPDQCRDYRIHTLVALNEKGVIEADIIAAGQRVAKTGQFVTNVALGATMSRVALNERDAYLHGLIAEQGSNAAPILSYAVRHAAEQAALAFGPGHLGVDIITDITGEKPYVLEVNPFSSTTKKLENEHGFKIYMPWAQAIARTVRNMRAHDYNWRSEYQ